MRIFLCALCFFMQCFLCFGGIKGGVGLTEITPPIGTPSAGYFDRKGEGMIATHDPLLAIALFLDNGEKQLAICSVDHLGFSYIMVQKVQELVHSHPALAHCEIYIASSHTHSGGGAHLDIPVLGEQLAGCYDEKITQLYVDKTAEAIFLAYKEQTVVEVGIGYGDAKELSVYRGTWPKEVLPLSQVAIVKVVKEDGTPLIALCNYPMHPTVLNGENRLFSADFVWALREEFRTILDAKVHLLYVNGAQGDILPKIVSKKDRFFSCQHLGSSLAATVAEIWKRTMTQKELDIATEKMAYTFTPKPTPQGLQLPIAEYKSEINLIVLNKEHAFITIPGELSCLYDQRLKDLGKKLGFSQLSIFGLTNDAHGYIITPDSWRHKTGESNLSFGGEEYGDVIEKKAILLLEKNMAKK